MTEVVAIAVDIQNLLRIIYDLECKQNCQNKDALLRQNKNLLAKKEKELRVAATKWLVNDPA